MISNGPEVKIKIGGIFIVKILNVVMISIV